MTSELTSHIPFVGIKRMRCASMKDLIGFRSSMLGILPINHMLYTGNQGYARMGLYGVSVFLTSYKKNFFLDTHSSYLDLHSLRSEALPLQHSPSPGAYSATLGSICLSQSRPPVKMS